MTRSNNKRIVYFVEGQTEKKLLSILKTNFQNIFAGKVKVVNPLTRPIRNQIIRELKPGTTVVLLFDTDAMDVNLDLLRNNIKVLKKSRSVDEIFTVTQSKNLEDELCYSTDVKQIKEITGSLSNSAFKRDFLRRDNLQLYQRLKEVNFSIQRIWSRKPTGIYQSLSNEGYKIKIAK